MAEMKALDLSFQGKKPCVNRTSGCCVVGIFVFSVLEEDDLRATNNSGHRDDSSLDVRSFKMFACKWCGSAFLMREALNLYNY